MPTLTDHDTDFHQWTQEQATLLRAGMFSEIDVASLAEEIEDMGNSNRRAVSSYIFVALMHLLKWKYQPQQQSSSWKGSIRHARRALKRLLRESPSLRPKVAAFVLEEYPDAREEAHEETGLSLVTFPEDCPFTIEQILEDYWPG